ncbi:MAG: alpha/beta hydrolase [Rhodospirillaceae bacterium]|nr:alpha/beta hydrolase [Rhodospirillaceae bacterium]
MFKFLFRVCAALVVTTAASAADLEFKTIDGHGGLPLNVAVGGNPSGPAIVFIHGMGFSYLAFEQQFKSDLAKDFKLVAFDLRGHGNSGKPWRREDAVDPDIYADDVAAVIAGTNLTKPVIVGWSYGGFVAADYVRKYGTENLAGLNLVASIAGLVPQPPPVGNISPEELKRRAVMQSGGDLKGNLTIIDETAKMFAFPGMSDELRDVIRMSAIMVPAYFRRASVGRSLDHQDVVPKMTMPLLVTMGSNDIAATPEPFERLKKALPKAKYSVYEGVGHLPFAQDSARFNQELAEFVKSTQKR